MQLKLTYDIGDRVTIDDIETDGTIGAIMVERQDVVTVRVDYWFNGDRKQTWVTPAEFTIKGRKAEAPK